MESLFRKNYLYELPEDIHIIIYKKVYQGTLAKIREKKVALHKFNKLVAYIKDNHFNKRQAVWSIFLCNRRDVGDPYYKYFTYYADNETDFLHLNKSKMIRCDEAYSKIRYIDFPIYPIQDRIPSDNFNYIKNTFEQYIHIFISLKHYKAITSGTNDKYRNIRDVKLLRDKIRIEFADTYVFRCHIDIYSNILETYNFILCILDVLSVFPEYNLDYIHDIGDLRDWFALNTFFKGFRMNDKGDTIVPWFYE